jgi:multiple sugar transport system substrate-binding protein
MLQTNSLKRRLFHLVALVTVLSTLLAACAAPTTEAPKPTAAAAQPTAAVKPTDAPKPTEAPKAGELTKDNITLRLLTPIFPGEQGKKDFEDTLLADWKKKYPNITVQVDYIPSYGTLNEKLTTAFASGQPPDVFTLGVGWYEAFASKDQVLALDPYITKETELDDYYQGAVDAAKWDGKLYGIPYVMDLRLIVYRKDMFQEAGLDPNKPPTTWDELRDYAMKLTKRDAAGKLQRAGLDVIQVGLQGSESPRQHWYRFLWEAGGDLFTPDLKASAFNSKAGVEALEFWVNLIQKDKVTDIGFGTGIPNTSLMSVDKAAMAMVHNRYYETELKTKPELAAKIGVVPPLKRTADGKQGEFVGGSYWSIAKSTKYPKEAWALVSYLTTKDKALQGNIMRGAVPPRKSLATSDYVKGNFLVKAAMDQYLPVSKKEGGPTSWLEIRSAFDPALQEAMVGKKTPKQALDELAAKADDIIKKAK